jgi:hypothetical protein
MEGRFENYTLGRNISMEKVKEIYHLFKKHQFQLAGLRSFGQYITDDMIAKKRTLAELYRSDPELFAAAKTTAGERLTTIPVMAKGVKASTGAPLRRWAIPAAAMLAGLGLWLGRRRLQSV